jgi:hypothetical protein
MKRMIVPIRRLRSLVNAMFLAAVVGGLAVSQAVANTRPTYYVALGDSVAWGFQPKSVKGERASCSTPIPTTPDTASSGEPFWTP